MSVPVSVSSTVSAAPVKRSYDEGEEAASSTSEQPSKKSRHGGRGRRGRGGRGGGDGGGGGGEGRKGRAARRGRRRTRETNDEEGEKEEEGEEEELDGEGDNDGDDGYVGPLPRSALFESYYRQQDIVAEAEWDEWIGALQRKLPVTFRLSSINGLHRRLLAALLKDEFGIEAMQLTVDGHTLHAPQPLSWYPDNMAWYLPVSKGQRSAAQHGIAQHLQRHSHTLTPTHAACTQQQTLAAPQLAQ